MNLKNLLYSQVGRNALTVIMALGLATLFYKACNDDKCINFSGPVISEIDKKTYKFGNYCYKYKLEQSKCDPDKKRIVQISAVQDVDSPQSLI